MKTLHPLSCAASGLFLVASLIGPAHAQAPIQPDWPTQPLTIVMTFPAGSGVDTVGRMLQDSLQKSLGQPIIIDYKPGAAGNVASEYVARARPDGYTVIFATSATHGVNAALYKKLPFDVEADFTPVSSIVDVSNVLTINPAVIDVKSVKEFVDLVKANPGKYNYASTGNGTGTHLAFAEFNAKADLNITHVPYKGGPDAVAALLKGEVCCYMSQVAAALPHYKANKIRLLGVTTKARVGVVSEVPTISESGVAGLNGFESFIWFGLFGPKGMDANAVNKLNAAIKKALDDPAVQQKLVATGNTVRHETPAQFRATVKADRAKWAEVVKASGATVD